MSATSTRPETSRGNKVETLDPDRLRVLRYEKEERIREDMKKGYIQPTQRMIGRRRYTERLPAFKEADSDMPAVRNIEGSQEPLK